MFGILGNNNNNDNNGNGDGNNNNNNNINNPQNLMANDNDNDIAPIQFFEGLTVDDDVRNEIMSMPALSCDSDSATNPVMFDCFFFVCLFVFCVCVSCVFVFEFDS